MKFVKVAVTFQIKGAEELNILFVNHLNLHHSLKDLAAASDVPIEVCFKKCILYVKQNFFFNFLLRITLNSTLNNKQTHFILSALYLTNALNDP